MNIDVIDNSANDNRSSNNNSNTNKNNNNSRSTHSMPSPPIKSLHFRGFDSSRLLILRGGILMSVESYRGLPESLTQGLLIGKLLVGGLGVPRGWRQRRNIIESAKAVRDSLFDIVIVDEYIYIYTCIYIYIYKPIIVSIVYHCYYYYYHYYNYHILHLIIIITIIIIIIILAVSSTIATRHTSVAYKQYIHIYIYV